LLLNDEITGHNMTAGQSFLRAATYRRAALHRHPDPYDPQVAIHAQLAVDAFTKFLTFSNYPCKPVEIPYEGATTLPGYLCVNPNVVGPAPTIIFNEGKDGWAEDGKFVVDAALPRGYHVLLYDGPGIGKVIRLQNLPFRHDWENVITPIVDYLSEMNNVVDINNVALISVSLGGYLGPRAAAYEPRLKALIANPGVMDWFLVYEAFLNEMDPNLVSLIDSDPEAFDDAIYQAMNYSGLLEWGMIDSMWHHNQTTPHGLMNEVRRFTNVGLVENITAYTMVIDAEMETRGQSLELYNALTNCPEKTFVNFTHGEAAQLHVQPGATGILTLRMFDWLDEVFAKEGGAALDETAARNMVDPSSAASKGPWNTMVMVMFHSLSLLLACCFVS
jgi:pimeloyl-ACP methyl ester carboxylesterase